MVVDDEDDDEEEVGVEVEAEVVVEGGIGMICAEYEVVWKVADPKKGSVPACFKKLNK